MYQEERQAYMQLWGAWMGGLKEKGQLVDGQLLVEDGKIVKNRYS